MQVVAAGKLRRIDGWKKAAKPAHHPLLVQDFMAQPAQVDLSPMCPPVGDQGQVGDCVTNALCECAEFLYRQAEADKLFSRLYLYYWARVTGGVAPTDDSGLTIPETVLTMQNRGVCLESTWDYSHPEARFSIQPPPEADTEAALHKTLLAFSLPNLFTIKACLAQGFPAAMGMPLPELFMGDAVAQTGELPFVDDTTAGGHAMLICGFDDAKVLGPGDVGALLVQNSWGTSWGLDGHVWVSYGYVRRGVISDVTTIRRAML